MNVVIFASDAKALSSLNSVIQEAGKQGIRLFAMVTHSTQLRHPKYQQNGYFYVNYVNKNDSSIVYRF